MDTVEYPTLTEADRPMVDRFAVGLDRDAARVLAYLCLRATASAADGPATRLELRIGTGLSRGAVGDVLGVLETRGLVTETTVQRHDRGRPPKAWAVADDVTPERVYGNHADRLLDHAADFGGVDPPPADDRTTSGADASLAVGLNWHANALHTPLYAGAAGGHYASAGVSPTFEPYTGSTAALDALVDGDADIALVGAATLMASDADDVVPLALLYERAMAVLYTTRDAFGGPFERVQQLRGRRVGMPAGTETALLARLLLAQVHTLSDVEIVDLTGEERDALESDRVDVVTGQVSDPERLAAVDGEVDAVPVADQFPLYGPALVTTERRLDAAPGALRAFLVGTMTGWADAVADPEAAVDAVPTDNEERGSRAVFELAAAEFGFDDDHGWGWHTESGWQRLRTALAQIDLPS